LIKEFALIGIQNYEFIYFFDLGFVINKNLFTFYLINRFNHWFNEIFEKKYIKRYIKAFNRANKKFDEINYNEEIENEEKKTPHFKRNMELNSN